LTSKDHLVASGSDDRAGPSSRLTGGDEPAHAEARRFQAYYALALFRDLGSERQNLTMRVACRRFTRLANALNKKLENLKAGACPPFLLVQLRGD